MNGSIVHDNANSVRMQLVNHLVAHSGLDPNCEEVMRVLDIRVSNRTRMLAVFAAAVVTCAFAVLLLTRMSSTRITSSQFGSSPLCATSD